MKKLLAVLAIVALVGGCATMKDWVCNNRVIIENAITAANSTITSIEITFPGVIPLPYQAAIDAARAIVASGEKMLADNLCPSDADVAIIQAKQITVQTQLKLGARLMRMQGK